MTKMGDDQNGRKPQQKMKKYEETDFEDARKICLKWNQR